ERYEYDPTGAPRFLQANFTFYAPSEDYSHEGMGILYRGTRYVAATRDYVSAAREYDTVLGVERDTSLTGGGNRSVFAGIGESVDDYLEGVGQRYANAPRLGGIRGDFIGRVNDFVGAATDTLSFGLSARVRNGIGWGNLVNQDSPAYM